MGKGGGGEVASLSSRKLFPYLTIDSLATPFTSSSPSLLHITGICPCFLVPLPSLPLFTLTHSHEKYLTVASNSRHSKLPATQMITLPPLLLSPYQVLKVKPLGERFYREESLHACRRLIISP